MNSTYHNLIDQRLLFNISRFCIVSRKSPLRRSSSCRTNSAKSRDRIYCNDIQFGPCAGRRLL